MKSLRIQLTVGLLLAFGLLLGAGDLLTYYSIHNTLARQFDDALLARAVTIASSVKADHRNVESHFSERIENGISAEKEMGYYQLWEMDGEEVLNHSSALGDTELPRDFSDSTKPKYFDLTLPDGTLARGIGFRFIPAAENETRSTEEAEKENVQMEADEPPLQLGLVVAASREKLGHVLNFVIFVIVLADVLTFLVAVWLVGLVLRRGLMPLNQLAEQARQIGAGSLNARFPAEGLPVELLPISQRLNDLLARLEFSFNEMSEYASKVTHELRTPLAILRLKLEQSAGKIPPDMAEDMQEEIQQLAYVVEQSLFIAKAGQGRLQLQPRDFDLADTVEDVVDDFSLLAAEQNRRVVLNRPSKPFPVHLDLKYARQIVHNLLSNALKHGQGDILVKLSGQRSCGLTILNRIRPADELTPETLGLGLRVVDSLLQLQPELKFRRRHASTYYAVKLAFPRVRTGDTAFFTPANGVHTVL